MNNEQKKANRLIHETSPYLLQHAYNPVDWYPWGDAAIETAKRQNKPILLSIGYATCHWCHVMESESFTDAAIAEIMNREFVCIKLDREERPDIDQIYITAVTAMTRSAGWPLNVFLTPDLKPFFGGTYFPAERRPGIVAWPDLLQAIASAWRVPEKRRHLIRSSEEMQQMLENALFFKNNNDDPDATLLADAFAAFKRNFDSEKGGFGPAPKFPMPGVLDFLLFFSTAGEGFGAPPGDCEYARKMAETTLTAIVRGGIYDHIGGGFHRYATDANWHVPHFEKMVYDNAQLVSTLVGASRLSGEERYLATAEETLEYVMRDMTHPEGAFYSAEDADSYPETSHTPGNNGLGKPVKKEGAFYVWSYATVSDILSPEDLELMAFRYGLKGEGNVIADPHGEFVGENILFAAHGISEIAEKFGVENDSARQRLEKIKTRMLAHRETRPRPERDDKVITEWNGLMITAFAMAYRATRKSVYLHAGQKAAEFILSHLYEPEGKRLHRSWRNGALGQPALAGDYAALVRALLDLYAVDHQPGWLTRAVTFMDEQIDLFYDTKHGGFFLNRKDHDPNLIVRMKEDQEGVMPSSNSVSALNLLRIARLTGAKKYQDMADETIRAVVSRIKSHPSAGPYLLQAVGMFLMPSVRIVMSGAPDDPEFLAMLKVAEETEHYCVDIIVVDGADTAAALESISPGLISMIPKTGKSVAHVCLQGACMAPVTSAVQLQKRLETL